MRIGILETGNVSDALKARFGDYPSIFHALIQTRLPDAEFIDVSIVNGEKLGRPDDADGWLITGSRHGVYEDLDWINALKAFVRDCVAQNVPLVGICFGHQLIAEAMGGKVEKSERGWGLGVHEYQTHNLPGWMADLKSSFKGYAVHQDQIVTPPSSAQIIASSEFCPYAAMVYGNPDAPDAITVQSHPEMTAEFVQGLIDTRLNAIVPAERVALAEAGLVQQVQNDIWTALIARFLEAASKRRASAAA
ncbi:type 1 glutamine amidotransferase [Abyssibius alkaniclasticus]|uniref:type 1 glutamine amidotransferase n=1 Tax=Abyssibius alkaniclasticus TaxID=2881234 RepID=UPI0040592C81|tara:strand:- start:885 stop:1631 length:747 start_codon:yes stop_codon:yes gene_type:complete